MRARKSGQATRNNTAQKRLAAKPVVLTALEERQAFLAHHVRMVARAERGHGKLPLAVCHEVVDFIARAGGNRQLSVRLFESSMKKVEYATETETDWQDLVRSQLNQLGQPDGALRPVDSMAHDLKCMAAAVERHPSSVKLQLEVWQTMTAKSRATFFRTKKAFEDQRAHTAS